MHTLPNQIEKYSHEILDVTPAFFDESWQPQEDPIDQISTNYRAGKAYSIRINDRSTFAATNSLIKKCFSWRGYEVSDIPATVLTDAPEYLSLVVTNHQQQSVGTMTSFFDRGQGLPADDTFANVVADLRASSRKIMQVGRLAIDDVPSSKNLLAMLIHISVIYAYELQQYTDCVVEVNPRHKNFYCKKLGFSELAQARDCPRVGAPAVLLGVSLQRVSEQAQKWAGKNPSVCGERSLFPYFLQRDKAHGVLRRFKVLHDTKPHLFH